MKETAESIKNALELLPHPEGGYYKETYRSEGVISKNCLPEVFNGERNYVTCIYFLLTSDTFSAFHKINQDESWHFYKGTSITLHIISPDGHYTKVVIGNNITQGQLPQYTVPGGHWFAATVDGDDHYALLGCTVAPGFDFSDFTLPPRADLLEQFPQHRDIITSLTRI